MPDIQAFDEPCLLLVTGDSDFGNYCPIILGTLHIDLILERATKEELEGLSHAWRRGGLGNRVMNQLAAVSGELDRCTGEVRVTRDIHVGHGETVQVDGRSDHPLNCKRVNVLLEPLNSPEGALIVRTYALIKGNSRRVPLVFRNLSGRKNDDQEGDKGSHTFTRQLGSKIILRQDKRTRGRNPVRGWKKEKPIGALRRKRERSGGALQQQRCAPEEGRALRRSAPSR